MRDWRAPNINSYWTPRGQVIEACGDGLSRMGVDEREAALAVIETSVRELASDMGDQQLAEVAAHCVDDLYASACWVHSWDDHLSAYLSHSAAALGQVVTERGMRIEHLVDNEWSDLTRPVELFPEWFASAGFVYSSPLAIAAELMHEDGIPVVAFEAKVDDYLREAREVSRQVIYTAREQNRHFIYLDYGADKDGFKPPGGGPARFVISTFRNEAPAPPSGR